MLRRGALASLLVLSGTVSSFAQAPSIQSVVNVASFDDRLSQGVLAYVWGSGLSGAAIPVVTVIQGSVVRQAWVSPPDISPNQLLIQMPVSPQQGLPNLVSGPAMLQVTVGGLSTSIAITLNDYAPGVFSSNGAGTGFGSFLRPAGSGGTRIGLAMPANPGETLRGFATGLGSTNPEVGTGIPAPSNAVPTSAVFVRVGGILIAPADVAVSLFPGAAGFYEFSFKVPTGLPKGRYPVIVSVGGQDSNPVQLPVLGPFAPGDLDMNDTPDLVWQNDVSSEAHVWYMGGAQGSTYLSGGSLTEGRSVSGWTVVGTGDFNGDGNPDLIWQHDASRQAHVWYMGGAGSRTYIGGSSLSQGRIVTGWKVVSTRDVNGDGLPDLVWQNDASRHVDVWYMGGAQGNTYLSGASLTQGRSVAGWRLAGIADFNGDSRPDLVWQNDVSRHVDVWFLGGPQGTAYIGGVSLTQGRAIAGWRLAGIADFNGDGRPDLVWQNDVSRHVDVWFLGGPQGNAYIGGVSLTQGRSVAGWRAIN